MNRYIHIVLCCLLLTVAPFTLKAQQNMAIKGIAVKVNSNERLARVKIVNLSTKEIRLSDDFGMFNIPASLGDTLEFSKTDYTTFKQFVANSNDIVIYLQPIYNLNTVVIKGNSIKQDQQEALNAYRSKGVYYNGKPSFLADVAHPLNGLYEAFSKDAKQARRFNAYVKTENENILIDKKFSKSLVKHITNLPDDELAAFMQNYRPTYANAVKWTDYDMIEYIKSSWESYKGSAKQVNEKLVP